MFREQTRANLEQIHRTKILGIDLDILSILLFSYYIAFVFKKNYIQMFILVLLTVVIIHRILRINTRINQKLFGKI